MALHIRQTRLRINKDDFLGATVKSKHTSHMADGTSAKYGHAVSFFDAGIFETMVRRCEDVREI